MCVPRVTFGPSRTVTDPDGRSWTIRIERYRLPRPGEEDDKAKVSLRVIPAPLRLFGLLDPVVNVVLHYGLPLFEGTIERRPWIVASAEHPPVRMVWRVWHAPGRTSHAEAVEEIASALERGDPRPASHMAKWVGYDQGALVLPPKAPR